MKLEKIDEGLGDLVRSFKAGYGAGQERVSQGLFGRTQPSQGQEENPSKLSPSQLNQFHELFKQLTPFQRKRLAVVLARQIKADGVTAGKLKVEKPSKGTDNTQGKGTEPKPENKPTASSTPADQDLIVAVKAAKAKPPHERDVQDQITIRKGAEKGIN